jgi:serine/threonine protein kinase/Tol biopolymer transport system component
MALSPGVRLGPYEILDALGAGGMGEVYRARDTRLGRDVAVKILPAEFSADPVRKQRFEREAKTISSLNHPHICVLHDVGSQDGISYLVMECVEGETLAKRLEKGPLPLEQVLKYGMQIADALDKAHRSGVVHRDLKPGNVMLTSSGAKLLDFGLAKPTALVALTSVGTLTAAVTQSSPMTEQGAIVGTFQYMSPEQVEGKELDGRSDIFSLGGVLYEMLTGERAFQGKSRLSVASAILEKEPAPISSVKPLTPPALDHAIRRCLAKDPEERWQTARDLSLELRWIGDAGSQAGTPTISGRGQSSARERIALATAAVLFILLGAMVFLSLNNSNRPAAVVRSAILPPPDTQFDAADVNAGVAEISPDGTMLVSELQDSHGKIVLWLRKLNDAGEGRVLPGTEGGGHPFWSPDSRSIGFFSGGKLKRIDADGNSLQTLSDAFRGRGGTWSPDGTILFTPTPSAGIYQVSASGGAAKEITALDRSHGESSHRWPIFLPDGKHFLFFIRNLQPERAGIYAGSLDSKEYHLVVKAYCGPVFDVGGTILYMRDDAVVAQGFDEGKLATAGEPVPLPDRVGINPGISRALFSASRAGVLVYYPALRTGGPNALTWYDRNGKRGEPLETGYFYGPALSPNGTQAIVPIISPSGLSTDPWIFDLKRGTKTRLTLAPGASTRAAWVPDGRSVLFDMDPKGPPSHIYRAKSDGTGTAEAVLESDGIIETPSSLCRDGRYLAYMRSVVGSSNSPTETWILPLTGDRKPFVLVQSRYENTQPAFSPDCKWIAYVSDESGRPEVYVTHFPDAARKYQVSKQGGGNPRWRGDGKELFYFSVPLDSMMAANVEEKGEELSLGVERALFRLANLNTLPLGSMFDVIPDGQRFLISEANSPPGGVPLRLVVNWDAELKKK